jgi:hypothetical protein
LRLKAREGTILARVVRRCNFLDMIIIREMLEVVVMTMAKIVRQSRWKRKMLEVVVMNLAKIVRQIIWKREMKMLLRQQQTMYSKK